MFLRRIVCVDASAYNFGRWWGLFSSYLAGEDKSANNVLATTESTI